MIRAPSHPRAELEAYTDLHAMEEARHQVTAGWPAERRQPGWTCGVCGITPDTLAPCGCDMAVYREVAAGLIDGSRDDLIVRTLGESGIPPRFDRATFDSFEPLHGTRDALGAAAAWAEAFTLETATGFLLAGRFGCGKTHLAVAALRVAIERTLVEGRFLSTGALIAQVRAGAPVDYRPVELAIGAELLVFDDIGQEVGTDFERGILARVVMGRYDEARPTVFTSNHGPKGLERTLGGAVVSRIREMAETHVILATDYREQRAS